MTRKSQLEKFEARAAKKRMDDEIVKQSEINGSKPERKAEKLVQSAVPQTTEEIFAVITHSGAEAFTKMWANSVESAVVNTMRSDEFKGMIRDIVRDELVGAARGIVTGMNQLAGAQVQSMMKEAVAEVVRDEVAASVVQEPQQKKPRKPRKGRSVKQTKPDKPHIKVDGDNIPRSQSGRIQWKKIEPSKQKAVFFQILEAGEKAGLTLDVSSHFQATTGDTNALYGRINTTDLRNISESWKELVADYRNQSNE